MNAGINSKADVFDNVLCTEEYEKHSELHYQGIIPIERDEGYYWVKFWDGWSIIFWSAELSMWLSNEPSVLTGNTEDNEINTENIQEVDPERIVRKYPKH